MDTRKEDYKTIEQGLNSKDPHEKRQAYIARERIRAESNQSKRGREKLVEAHRGGNRGEIDKIHRQLEGENKRIKGNIEKYYSRRSGY